MSGNSKDRRLNRRKVLRASPAAAVIVPTAPSFVGTHNAFFAAPAVITAAAATPGQSRAPKIDIVAYNGGEVLVDGFDLPVVVDFAGLHIPPTVPLNVDHQQDIQHLLGYGATALNANSLSISGSITATNPSAQEVVRLATDKDNPFPWQASIKAIIYAHRRVAPGQQVQINGRMFTGPFIHAIESQLTHCAVLGEGADQTSSVRIAAKAAQIIKGQSIMTFEQWLASLGVDQASANPALLDALKAQFAAANPTAQASAATAPPPQTAVVAAASGARVVGADSPETFLVAQNKAYADNLRRVAVVTAKAKDFPLIAAKAIEEGWDEHRTELEVIKANRPTGPSHQAVSQPAGPLVLEAALAATRRIPGHEKQYTDQVLQAAHSSFPRGIGLQQFLLIAAAANGYQVGPGMRISQGNLKSVLKAAFMEGPMAMQAAASGGGTSGILSNIANKELLSGYFEDDQTWREIAAIKSVNDFKTVTSYRMLDNFEYEELGPNGQITHGTLSEETYTRRAKTYAKMGGLTRVDIINDDLGAYDDLKTRVGRGASQKFNRKFWGKLLGMVSSGFFAAGNGNYISGATTNLGVDGVGLQLGILKFDAMRTPAADGSKVPGGAIGGQPKILLHGPSLQFNANRIYQSTTVNTGGAATSETVGNDNIHAGKYKPVKSVFMEDSSLTGYSSTAWALFRDPKVLAAIVVSFLNGVETPTVEQSDADFDVLGILFRGYHDFGIDEAEKLAAVWSKGAN